MTVYRLYVFLLDIAPPIWRRVELSSETSLAQLHKVLQSAMGWQDYHLHEFGIGGQRYGVPDEEFDQPGEVVKDSTVKIQRPSEEGREPDLYLRLRRQLGPLSGP